MNSNRFKNYIGIGFSMIGILILLYISYFGLTHLGTWYDEIFSMWVVNLPYSEFWTIIFRDVHPPLYYLIYKAFIILFNAFNYNDAFIIGKIVSLVPIYLLILLACFKVRKNFGMLTTGLFIFSIVSMPLITQQILNIRMYGWALLFLTATFIYIYETVKDPSFRNWTIITVLTICSCYTQYFSLLGSVILYFLFLIYIMRRNRDLLKKWFVSAVICIAAYVPWIPIVYSQFTIGQGGYWIEKITAISIVNYIYQTFSPLPVDIFISDGMSFASGLDVVLYSPLYIAEILIAAAFIIAIILLILNSVKTRNHYTRYAYAGILSFILLPVIGITISLILYPIFFIRYLVPMLGIFWLSISILIACLYCRKRKLSLILIALLLVVGCLNVANTLDYEQTLLQKTVDANNTLHESIGLGNIIILDQKLQRDDWKGYIQLKSYYLPDNEYYIITDNISENIKDLLNNQSIKSKINNGSKVFYLTNRTLDKDFQLDEVRIGDIVLHDIELKMYEIKWLK